MTRWTAIAPALLLAAAGCLASKGDIRLLQDELRATRAQVGMVDTSIIRTNEQRRQQISVLSASIDRLNDSVRVLATRLASFQATVNGELDATNRQMLQVLERLGQTTKNIQDARAQLEALKEQSMSNSAGAPPPATAPRDTNQRVPPGTPGPATMFNAASDQFRQGSFNSARMGFDDLLNFYPTFEQASLAQLRVAEAYSGLGNTPAADSVYQLVAARYPKSDEAATALYKRGRILVDTNKKDEARTLFNKVVKDYPGSDAAGLSREALRALRTP